MRPAPRPASPRPAADDVAQDAFRRYGAVLLLLTATFTFAMIAPTGAWARLVTALLQGGAVLAALSRARADRRLVVIGLIGSDFHFLADVVAGGFVGASTGWLAVLMWQAGGPRQITEGGKKSE